MPEPTASAPVTHKVRTTMQPDIELEVGEAEFLDLQRQKLLVETKATTPEGIRKAAVAQSTQVAAAAETADTTKES